MVGWEVAHAPTLADARRLLRQRRYAVGLLLLNADHDNCGALDGFLREHWTVQWVAVLNAKTMQHAVWRQLVQEHCCDFHTWPVDPSRLGHTLGHAHGLAALGGIVVPPSGAA
ncbi:VpsR-related response regulator, partial [Rugamonas sp.]|uniref:VpsR-related response regulator n=1 Tax=Rugamonas sp. TaxID=1926287 RepID=UPI0025F6500A